MSMSINLTTRFVLVSTLLVALIGATGWAEATQVVLIDDRTDTITATVNGVPVTFLPGSTSEFVHFTYQLENNARSPITSSTSVDFLEPGTGARSDTIVRTLTLGSQFVDFLFDSQDILSLPPGQFAVFETGSFQSTGFLDYAIFDPFGAGAEAQILVASDVVEVTVPEPASLALVGLGLAGLLGFGRRK